MSAKFSHAVLTILFASTFIAVPTLAEVIAPTDITSSGDTITAKHRYMMGDNDSKSDATTICFLEAKRKVIEYAGIYVESTVQISQTENSRKASSDMKTIAAALVSAEMASSNTGLDNGSVYIDCVVNAKVDKSKLKENIEKITANPAFQKQVEEQQLRLKKLEDELHRVQNQLQTVPHQETIALRQARTVVFKEIDALQQKKLEIISFNERKGEEAKQLIEKGMTSGEVTSLLGSPRAVKCSGGMVDSICGLNYGKYWVIEAEDFVFCVSTTSNKKGCIK